MSKRYNVSFDIQASDDSNITEDDIVSFVECMLDALDMSLNISKDGYEHWVTPNESDILVRLEN